MPTPIPCLVDQYGRPLTTGSGIAGGNRFLDASDSSNLNRPAFSTRLDDINRLVPAYDRRVIVGACERLVSNFDVIEGMLWSKAMYAVGRAWEPQSLAEDQASGEIYTDWLLNEWYKIGDLGGAPDSRFNLELDSVTVDRSGEFLVLLSSFDGGYPATQRIPGWRIGVAGAPDQMLTEVLATRAPNGTPVSDKGQPVKVPLTVPMRLRDGFIYDARGRKVYCRVRVDNGLSLTPSSDFVDVHTRDFIHVFDRTFYDQAHGWPSLTASANKLRDALTSHQWEQLALLIASSIGMVEYNETGTQQTGDKAAELLGGGSPALPAEKFNAEVLFGGLVRYFKAGSGAKLQQFINERPGPIWDAFQDRIIRAAARGMNWSPMLAWGKDNPGGQVARADIDQANLAVKDRQDLLRMVKAREDGYAISKAIQLGILPPYKGTDPGGFLKLTYTFPAEISIDDNRDGQNLREDYKIGFVNDRKVFAIKGGKSVAAHWAERAADTAVRKRAAILETQKSENVKLGVVVNDRDMQMLSPNEQPDAEIGKGDTGGPGDEVDGSKETNGKTTPAPANQED